MEFTWKPDLGAKKSVEPAVTVTSFNGYESRTPKSIHSNLKSWSCVFTRNLTEINAMEEFLETAGGVKSFLWTDPKGETSTYVCRNWESTQQDFGLHSLTATFKEVFEVK
jgi:phage-related protein